MTWNNSEFIITNIFNNYNIYIIKGETSISFKSDYRVLSILKTEYAGHARHYAETLDYTDYDGLCAIGGDGTMYELINGMLEREDQKMLPIALITGGTVNSFMYDVNCLDPI